MARSTRNGPKKGSPVDALPPDEEAQFNDDDSGIPMHQPSPPSPPTTPPSPPTVMHGATDTHPAPAVFMPADTATPPEPSGPGQEPPLQVVPPSESPPVHANCNNQDQPPSTPPGGGAPANTSDASVEATTATPPGKKKKVTIYGFIAGGKVKLYRTKKAAQKYESEWGSVIDTRNTFTTLEAALKWKTAYQSKTPGTPDTDGTKAASLDTSNMSPEDSAKLSATLNRVQSRAPKNTIKLVLKMAPGSNAAALVLIFQGRNGQDVWYLKGRQLSLALSSFFMDFPVEDNPTVQKSLVWMKAAQKKEQETRSAASMGSPKNKKQKRVYDEHYAWSTIMVDDRSEMEDEYYRDFIANTAAAIGETIKRTMSSDIFLQVYQQAVESDKLWGTCCVLQSHPCYELLLN